MLIAFGIPYHGKTRAECRAIGRRGGRASAAARRARLVSRTMLEPEAEVREESAAEAIAALDMQFPWLVNAERRR